MSLFRFKQFAIEQSAEVFKVSTDSVILGAWANVQSAKRILDLGCGTGLLALMSAQRNPSARIDAIDSNAKAIQLAERNFNRSSWNNRLNAIHSTLHDFEVQEHYDHVICNPPYFNAGKSILKTARERSRHAAAMQQEEIVSSLDHLLAPKGRLSIILPEKEAETFSEMMISKEWNALRMCRALHKEGKSQFLVLTEWSKHSGNCEESSFFIRQEDANLYTLTHDELTQDFYLEK